MQHDQLSKFFDENRQIACAFSGGVDSSYLIYSAKSAGCEVRAYFIKSQFQPEFEMNDAIEFAANHNVPLTVVTFDALEDSVVAHNPHDRCYYCKCHILKKIRELAGADGIEIICDGTNADDDESDRPGMRAMHEYGILSPLRECGYTKADIRRLSKEAGLSTHDKPSYACLATRIPTGTLITAERLKIIEHVEETLFKMGFSDLRVRFMPPDGAKIQLPDSQMGMALEKRAEILKAFSPIFKITVLDLLSR